MSALGIALLSLGLLAAGAAIGFYLARLGQSAEQAKLDEVESEFDAYREQVTEHFAETASRFTAIGQQYRELYDHLATGSEALCLTDKIEGKLPFPPAEASLIVADEPRAEVSAQAEVEPGPDQSAEASASETELVEEASDELPAEASAGSEADSEAERAAVAEIDSGDEPADAPSSDESADDGEAEHGTQAETAAAGQKDAEAGEPLEGEIVAEDAAVTDNVVELVPRGEAREDETTTAAETADDGDDKRTYH